VALTLLIVKIMTTGKGRTTKYTPKNLGDDCKLLEKLMKFSNSIYSFLKEPSLMQLKLFPQQ